VAQNDPSLTDGRKEIQFFFSLTPIVMTRTLSFRFPFAVAMIHLIDLENID
jgi:hypothetical protein